MSAVENLNIVETNTYPTPSELMDTFFHEFEDFFRKHQSSTTWAAVVADPETGKLNFVKRPYRPCFGEMRRYGRTSTRPKDAKPSDLTQPIDKGPRLAIGITIGDGFSPFKGGPDKAAQAEMWNETLEFLFSEKSPWIQGINPEYIRFVREDGDENGAYIGVVLTDTNIDPTVWVSLCMFLRNLAGSQGQLQMIKYIAETLNCSILEALLLRVYGGVYYYHNPWDSKSTGKWLYSNGNFGWHYFLSPHLDLCRFATGDSRDLSNGRTMLQEEDYNRPELPDIFQTDAPKSFETDLSARMADLAGTKGQMIEATPKTDIAQKFLKALRTIASEQGVNLS